MKYFLHDSNSFNDEKITELFIEFGYEGLGLFYTALEKLAQQEKPIKTVVLKSQLKVGKKLEKCWNFMETLGILSSNNGETFNKQLMNFSGKYAIKKEKNAKRISEWRENQENAKNVTCYKSVRNTDKVNKSKVKLSKENIITPKVVSPDFEKIKVFLSEHFDEKYITPSAIKTIETLKKKYEAKDIARAVGWGRGDPFWSKNFLSPNKLGQKDKSGVLYIDIFLENSKNQSNGKSNKSTVSGDFGKKYSAADGL